MSRLSTLYFVHNRVVSYQIGASAGLRRYAFKGRTIKETFPNITLEERYKLTKVVSELSVILNQVREVCHD